MAQQLANVDWKNMPRDLALIRMENDAIQAMALSKPRDPADMIRSITQKLKAYPAFARNVLYNKPVGRKPDVCRKCGAKNRRGRNKQIAERCWKCGHNDIAEGPMQFAKGLSIRAAEALAESYGFNRVHADIEAVGDDKVKITASFTDFCTSRVWSDSRLVSKHYRTDNGQMATHSDDRFYNVVIPAEKSRLIREVINRSVDPGLRTELIDRVEDALTRLLDEATIGKIIDKFAIKGVDLHALERFLGASKQGWTHEHRQQLLGVWNAIEEGETSVAEAFDLQNDVFESEPPPTPSADESSQVDPREDQEIPDVRSEPEPVEPIEPAKPATPASGRVTANHFLRPQGEAGDRPPARSAAPAPAKSPAGAAPPPPAAQDQSAIRKRLTQHAGLLGLSRDNIQFDKLIADALALEGTDQQRLDYITDVSKGVPGLPDYSVPRDQSAADAESISELIWAVNEQISKAATFEEAEASYRECIEEGVNTIELELLDDTLKRTAERFAHQLSTDAAALKKQIESSQRITQIESWFEDAQSWLTPLDKILVGMTKDRRIQQIKSWNNKSKSK